MIEKLEYYRTAKTDSDGCARELISYPNLNLKDITDKINEIIEYLNRGEEVDVEPIRHGHWIPVNPDVYGAEYFECSVCGMYSRDGLFRKELDYEYCPYCGAKMDEVSK